MNASSISIAETLANSYRAKRSRRTHIIDEILGLEDIERNDLVGQLLTMLEDQANGKIPTLRRASDIPGPMPSVSSISRDWVGKPRFSDLIRNAIKHAGKPISSTDIFKYAKSIRPDVKRSSLDTIVSRMGSNKELKKVTKDGERLYDLPG